MASNPISVAATTPNARRSDIGRFLQPVENGGLRLLVLENISQQAVSAFRTLGFHVDHYTKAMSEEELIEKIPSYHAIGIRSKTKITSRVISAAPKVRRPFAHLHIATRR
jgi:D-3-phosphoglycerate dehydrogenase